MNSPQNTNPSRVYFDHNATTPLSPRVREALPDWLEHFGNPSSIHWGGRGPKNILRNSRKNIAHLIGCDPLEVVFTAGGSEANNLALKGVYFKLKAQQSPRNHYLLSAVEHPSLLKTAEFLQSLGAEVEFYPVPRSGKIDLDDFAKYLKPSTALVSFMLANNETGNVFPIKKMVKLAHEVGALFHTDAVQALGKIPMGVNDLGVDLASFAGHKFYALKGAGVLFQRKGLQLESLVHGGAQERHRRAGTENALAIASLGLLAQEKDKIIPLAAELAKMRDHFEDLILHSIADVQITGRESPRLPNTSSLVLPGVEGEVLLMNLDMEGFAVSTGAACSSGSPEPSATLLALGLTRDEAQSSLRVSFGWGNNLAEVERFATVLTKTVERLRSFQNQQVQHV